jgi:Protein of unknown function (DUF2877)
VRILAAASSALRRVLAGPARPAECLGVARGALYLRIAEPPGALVMLSHDAARLPCGLLLPATSAELPLTSLVPPSPSSAGFGVGDNAVSWTGPAGPVVVRAAREWAPARPARGTVTAGALAAVRSGLGLDDSGPHLDRCEFCIAGAIQNSLPWADGGAEPRLDARFVGVLARACSDYDASVGAAAGLLGRGPGLTPAGDDLLAGFLVGTAALGLDAAALRQAIAVLAPARTTALSAALLWHAARGECIDELAAVAAVLTSQQRHGPEHAGRAARRLVSVGHSSGAALALGLMTAAEAALARQEGVAA